MSTARTSGKGDIPLYYWFQGFLLGLAYVAPIGVQNMFVINSAMTRSRRGALLTALIVIFFDVTLALCCFFGAGSAIQKYRWLQVAILGIGGAAIIKIGVGLILEKTRGIAGETKELSVKETVVSACVVTWCNPQAIIDDTMLLGAFYVTLPREQSAAFFAGVICASATWFISLSLMASAFMSKVNAEVLRIINTVCGVIIVFCGLRLLYGLTKFM